MLDPWQMASWSAELEGALRQSSQKLQVAVVETIEGPHGGLPSVPVEVLGAVDAATHPVVIAAHGVQTRPQRPHPVEDAVGRCAITDRVTQKDHAVETFAPHMGANRLQCLPVGVDITQDQVPHGTPCTASATVSTRFIRRFISGEGDRSRSHGGSGAGAPRRAYGPVRRLVHGSIGVVAFEASSQHDPRARRERLRRPRFLR